MKKKIPEISLIILSASVLVLSTIFILTACAPPVGSFAGNPSGTSSSTSNPYQGYILIASSGNKTVQLYRSDMTFVRTILTLGSTDVPASLAKFDDTHVLVAVEGGASGQDRVLNVNIESSNDYFTIINDVNFTGTVKGLARLSGGDILVSDGAAANIERFVVSNGSTLAIRLAIGWPFTALASVVQISAASSSNGWLTCSSAAVDSARTYTNSGTTVASATATAPVPSLGAAHDVNGCVYDPQGRVAVIYNGATDSLRVYPSTLASTTWTYTDATKFANPQALAVRPNGNFLVLEFATPWDFVVEVDSNGNYVNSYTPAGTNTGTAMLVMP